MPIEMLDSNGLLKMDALYFLATLVRGGYQPLQLQPLKDSSYGPGSVFDWQLVDYSNNRRTTILDLKSGIAVGSTGLLATDWPFVIQNGQTTVNVNGIFNGGIMLPVLQVFTWTWPTIFSYLQQTFADKPIVFAGHSFGGALSVLYAWIAKQTWPARDIRVVMFGAPRFADANFAASVPVPVLRIENQGDTIPGVPFWLGYSPVGVGWTLFRSGLIYPQYPEVLMADGTLLPGSSATIVEKFPRAKRQSNGVEVYGANAPAVLAGTTTAAGDMHAIGEYTRRIRRFLPEGITTGLDTLNNVFSSADGVSWRIPIPLASPFSPPGLPPCPPGDCPPALGC